MCRERRLKIKKLKKKGQNGGNFPTQRIFEWEKDKNFGETIFGNKLHVSSVKLHFPKIFWQDAGCSLIIIVTLSKNIAINKKYTTKTALFAAF